MSKRGVSFQRIFDAVSVGWRMKGGGGVEQNNGSISVSGQLPTYPSPSPTLTLTCYQLTVVELGEG